MWVGLPWGLQPRLHHTDEVPSLVVLPAWTLPVELLTQLPQQAARAWTCSPVAVLCVCKRGSVQLLLVADDVADSPGLIPQAMA